MPRPGPSSANRISAGVEHGSPCDSLGPHAHTVRLARGRLPAAPALESLVDLFALLSNDTRLRLVLALQPSSYGAIEELCVCDLAAIAGATESMTSHQLRLLREAGVVQFRREGKRVLYRLVDGPLRHLLEDALEHARSAGAQR